MNAFSGVALMRASFASPEWELACDEALLDAGEAGEISSGGVLRFWEAESPFVVLGYANRAAMEVTGSANVPVLRRCSGGGSVLQGPGCLNYSLVLPISTAPELASITATNCFIMKRQRDAIAPLVDGEITVEGYTDLALDGRKFSGNSQRRKSGWLLFHGTFLLRCDFELMEKVLLPPPREPAYRNSRKHSDFLSVMNLPEDVITKALVDAWQASEPFASVPHNRIEALVETKYSRRDWNFRI